MAGFATLLAERHPARSMAGEVVKGLVAVFGGVQRDLSVLLAFFLRSLESIADRPHGRLLDVGEQVG